MAERFIALATLLRPPAAAIVPPQARGGTAQPGDGATRAAPPSVAREDVDFAHADVASELALMRLAAIEAFEAATARLLRAFSEDVLARELRLAPADIAALAAQALAAFAADEPVAIAVAPADRERVHAAVPVRVDATLNAGDLVVYVRDGAFESPFAFRSDDALIRARLPGVR